ncbi:uracil-DNA glycosylase [Catellatospora sp. NEAU-YM18]|nr:uracil-DNA glycosylase [Catellatospora tritici]
MAVVHAHGGTVTAAESATVLRYGEAAEAGRVTDTTAPATGGEGAEPGSATTAPALSELRQQRVHQSWHAPLAPCLDQLAAMMAFLRDEVGSGHACQPAQDAVLRAFRQPFEDVRVVIVGQDPYPAPGHAVGLSFSVAPEVTRLPGSLRNIFHEYSDDLGLPVPGSGDLTAWTRRGVLLLNRVLTVREGMPASHRGKGWEAVTDAVIRALAARPAPLVAILWGTDARALTELLGDTPVVASPHPSAMSAASGFFGSRPFSTANRLLAEQGGQPVDWRLP